MDEKIEIRSRKEGTHTAKEAMQQVVERMNAKTDQVITVITLGQQKENSENILFVKMFLRFLHKNKGRVLLLAENEVKVAELEEYIAQSNTQIQVVERMNLEENGISADMILNRINGAEAECIIAALPKEKEEAFLEEYHTALDAKIWFGIGTNLKRNAALSKMQKLWQNFVRQFSGREN